MATTITAMYNSIMQSIGMDHRTIGTATSEITTEWTLRDMLSEVDYWLNTYDGKDYFTEEQKKAMRIFINCIMDEALDTDITVAHGSKFDRGNYVRAIEPFETWFSGRYEMLRKSDALACRLFKECDGRLENTTVTSTGDNSYLVSSLGDQRTYIEWRIGSTLKKTFVLNEDGELTLIYYFAN